MAEKQKQELSRILNHLRENAPAQPTNDGSSPIGEYDNICLEEGGGSHGVLDDDHPYSAKWPEVFCNGRKVFSEQFYSHFPFLEGVDPFESEANLTFTAARNPSVLQPGLPDRTAEAPPALAFVNSLISLELNDLPDDDQSCPVCMEPYRMGMFEEMPLELPCGHVICNDCLLSWLSTFSGVGEGSQSTSCPHCRQQTPIEQRMGIDTPAGLAQLLRDANYHLMGSGPLVLDRKSRRHWEVIKKYANDYLGERRLCDQEYALLEQQRKMNERKVEIFMVLMKDHISEYAQSFSSLPTTKQKRIAEHLIHAVRWFERRGLVEAYLDLKDGVDVHDGDLHLTVEGMNTELAALPYPLPSMMDFTYSTTLK